MIKTNNSFMDNARNVITCILSCLNENDEKIQIRPMTEIKDVLIFAGFNPACGPKKIGMFYHPQFNIWVPYLVVRSFSTIILINNMDNVDCKIEVFDSTDIKDLGIKSLEDIIVFKRKFVGKHTHDVLEEIEDATACLLW